MHRRRPAWIACAVALLGCVPIDPLALEVPDASPACAAADACEAPGVEAARCEQGRCVIERCEDGLDDADGRPENGCEACAATPGPDRCDGVDSDCDGRVDEDGDGTIDACGGCDVSCDGPEATFACRASGCVVEACDPGRYAVGGPQAGCPCALDAVTAHRIRPRRLPEPIAPRVAFPGDGRPGVIAWTAVDGEDHVLQHWSLSADGHPQGPPTAIATLDGPHDVVDAWYADDTPVTLLEAPRDGGAVRLVAWRGDAPTVLSDDCRPDRCLVVRLPRTGAGLVSLTIDADRFRIRDPDANTLVEGGAPADGPSVRLVDAACLAPDRCLVVYRRGDDLEAVGLIDGLVDGLDEVGLTVVGDRIWFVVRTGEQLVVADVDGEGAVGDPVFLPMDGGRAARLLPLPTGEAWLVALVDDRPMVLKLDAQHRPVGEARRISAGIDPVGMASDDLFFDDTPRAGTVERLVWSGLPDPRPAARVAPVAVGDAAVFRGRSGLFAAPLDADEETVDARLLLRRLDTPDAPPSAAVVDGRPLAVDPGPEGLTVVDVETGERRTIGLVFEDRPATLRAGTSPALATDGGLAVTGILADGRPVLGLGHVDGPDLDLSLGPAGPETTPRLLGPPDGPRWLVTRSEPGVGFETLVRRVDLDGAPYPVARRTSRPADAAAIGDALLVAWLDRRTDRCDQEPDQLYVARIGQDGRPSAARRIELHGDPCPVDVEVIGVGAAAQLVISTADDLRLLALDGSGDAVAPPASAPFPVTPPASDDGGVGAMWSRADLIERVTLDCRGAP